MSRHAAYSFINNPWNQRRIDRNLTYSDLAKEVNIPEKVLNNIFCGMQIAKPDMVDALCKYFGVDPETGYLEFQHIHNARKAAFPLEKKLNSARVKKPSKKRTEQSSEKQPETDSPKSKKNDVRRITASDFLAHFYGKISHSDYEILRSAVFTCNNVTEIVNSIYHNISCGAFVRILRIIWEITESDT